MTRHTLILSDAGTRPVLPMTRQREEALAQVLPLHIEMLGQRRAAELPRGDVQDYLALGWLRWAGGRIVVTPMGMGIRNRAGDGRQARASGKPTTRAGLPIPTSSRDGTRGAGVKG